MSITVYSKYLSHIKGICDIRFYNLLLLLLIIYKNVRENKKVIKYVINIKPMFHKKN